MVKTRQTGWVVARTEWGGVAASGRQRFAADRAVDAVVATHRGRLKLYREFGSGGLLQEATEDEALN